MARTDSVFRARYSPLKSAALGLYDLHFQKQWQKRWHYLFVDQQLSIQDIGRHDAVVQISLKDTLGPRWMSIASSVASFRPVDHLTALSTISDREFASVYYDMLPGLAFDAAFIRDWQQANASVWYVNSWER